MCNTNSLRVTPNLWDLLHQLRDAQKSHFLWADAICIDQSNVAERSQQVRLMGDIYAKASKVFVWLGVKDSRAQAAFLGIEMAVNMMAGNPQFVDNYGGYSSSDLDAFDQLKPGERSMTHEILRLFENPWFSRVWVLQEVGLASKVIVICGSEVIDWNHIGSVAMFFRKKEKLLLEHLNCSAVVNKVFHLYLTFQRSFEDIRNEFLYVLDNARPYLATDPRDKVYALLAHRTAQTEHGKPFVEPDYSMSLLEVYRDLTLRMIECDSNVEVLSAVQHDPGLQVIDDDFPSWVPRWDQHFNCRMLGRYTDKHFAGGNSEAVVTPTENINILRVQGILFDSILSHTHILNSTDFNLVPMAIARLNPVKNIWIESGCNDNVTATYPRLDVPSDPSLKKAYISTLTAGMTVNPDGCDMLNPTADFSAYWLKVYEQTLNEEDTDNFLVDTRYLATLRNEAAQGDWHRFREAAAEVCHMRKFFFSSKGFFGLGPGSMQADDLVCVLFGADTPFVLRRVGSRYKVVGECYVHGLMQGQARRAWRRGEFRSEEFELC